MRWRAVSKVGQPLLVTPTSTTCLFRSVTRTFPFRDNRKTRPYKVLECLLTLALPEDSWSWDFLPPLAIRSTICRAWHFNLCAGSWTSILPILTPLVNIFSTSEVQAVLESLGSSMLCGTYSRLEVSHIASKLPAHQAVRLLRLAGRHSTRPVDWISIVLTTSNSLQCSRKRKNGCGSRSWLS